MKDKKIKNKHSHTGKRFAHCRSIAPNASSSIICGTTSPSVEPLRANAYRHKTMSGSFLVKNKYLEKILDTKAERRYTSGEDQDKWKDKIWSSIVSNEGSIQHLDCFSEEEKAVFRTAIEIDQDWIVEHAGDRQNFIDQAQSINLFFPSDVKAGKLHSVHKSAWQKGLKTLYYCRSISAGRTEKLEKELDINLNLLDNEVEPSDEVCISCEG